MRVRFYVYVKIFPCMDSEERWSLSKYDKGGEGIKKILFVHGRDAKGERGGR